MPEPAINATPYGLPATGTLQNPQWPPDHREVALARAAAKLAAPDDDPPVAKDRILTRNFFLTLGVPLLAALAYAMFQSRVGTPGVWVWLIVLLFSAWRAYRAWNDSGLADPDATVRTWVLAIRTRRWELLDRIRVGVDRDDFARMLPASGASQALPMATLADIQVYWTQLLARERLSRSQWLVAKSQYRLLGPGVGVVAFQLQVSSWANRVAVLLFLLFVLGMITFHIFAVQDTLPEELFLWSPLVMAMVATLALVINMRRRKFELKKLVVNRGGQWRIFNAEWQGPEERDLRWLRQAGIALPPASVSN